MVPLTPRIPATATSPKFAIRGPVRRGERFVVATIDPDAPTPQSPTLAQIRHLVAGDLVPKRLYGLEYIFEKKLLINLTAPLSDWVQPGPPPGLAPHRCA